jgi:hypothetical protein
MYTNSLSKVVQSRLSTKTTTDQGLHIYKGVSSFAGVLPYAIQDSQGNTLLCGILQSPDELFNEASLKSMVGVGVYLDHPLDLTDNLDNAVGIVLNANPSQQSNYYYPDQLSDSPNSEKVNGDTYYIELQVAIWDENAVLAIQNGKKEISAGYLCKVVEEDGLWFGTPYQYKKTDIRYNHLALLDNGTARNGAFSRLLDTSSLTSETSETKNLLKNQITENFLPINIIKDSHEIKDTNQLSGKMKHFLIPGTSQVIAIEDSSLSALVDYTTEVTKINNEIISLKAELEKTKKELKDSNTLLEEKEKTETSGIVPSELSNALAVIKKAESLGVKIDLDSFDTEKTIKATLVAKNLPTDNVSIETLKYAFYNLLPDEPEPPVTPSVEPTPPPTTIPEPTPVETVETKPITDKRGTTKSNTAKLLDNVAHTPINGISGVDLARKIAEMRKIKK